MFDARLLSVFREVATRGSFSDAATALSFTQPAISQQIARLERQLETRLLVRDARGVTLTHTPGDKGRIQRDGGEAVHDHAGPSVARRGCHDADARGPMPHDGPQVRRNRRGFQVFCYKRLLLDAVSQHHVPPPVSVANVPQFCGPQADWTIRSSLTYGRFAPNTTAPQSPILAGKVRDGASVTGTRRAGC